MIEVSNFEKRFGRVTAVKKVSFVVPGGQIFGLLGPNGAGKTTTIRAITGLTRPTSGTIRVAGFDVWKEPVKAKGVFGYIPDRPYLYGKLTARELLRFIAGLHKLQNIDSELERWLEFFSLEHYANELIETYSHGMKQKLTIIAAFLPQPPVLIVDEPMVGLDPKAAKQTRELFSDYAEKGNTVLLTTHSLPVAEAVAHRIAVLDRGQVLAEGTLEDLQARTNEQRSGVEGNTLERIFFKLVEEEALEREKQKEAA
ncbi:MAG: ABC transporter ATP-binding protein [Deinococcales bacterium]